MAMSDASQEEQSYDEIPYASYPIYQSHPARIAAIARIYGLVAAQPSTARILELGCAAGGNIIPLAAQYPNATFLGIDISGVQIASGQAYIDALGLKNITLKKMSISDISAADGEFDYIISHGIISWIPPTIRQDLLRVSHDNLSPNGVAFISYNALPGWHLKSIIRDFLKFHRAVHADQPPTFDDLKSVLELLKPVATSSYGPVVADEMQVAINSDKFFLAHDYLETCNTPWYLSEFLSMAKQHKLAYLNDADTYGTVPDRFDQTTIAALRLQAQNDPIIFEQYLDFLSGRMFRMSLLVKDTHLPQLRYTPVSDAFMNLHFTCTTLALKDLDGAENPAAAIFAEVDKLRDADAATFAQYPVTIRALEFLLRTAGQTRLTTTIAEVAQAACQGEATATELREVRDLIVEMFRKRLLFVYAEALGHSSDQVKPRAYELARQDATLRRQHTSNAFHQKVSLGKADYFLLPLLDGTRDQPTLIAAIVSAFQDGNLQIAEAAQSEFVSAEPQEQAEILLAQLLDCYGKINLL